MKATSKPEKSLESAFTQLPGSSLELPILACSPHKHGNSDAAAQLLHQGATEAGVSAPIIMLRDHHIQPCNGCGQCEINPGQCAFDSPNGNAVASRNGTAVASRNGTAVASRNGTAVASRNGTAVASRNGTAVAFQDDAASLFARLWQAQGLLITLPVYFYGPPAVFKAFVDRAQPFWWKLHQGIIPKTEHQRPAFVVMVASRVQGPRLFDANLLILRCFFQTLGFTLMPPLLLRGLDAPQALHNSEKMSEQVYNLGRQAGFVVQR